MKAQANVNLHNEFLVERRDAFTGELKQTAKAYNIVLDAMWTRLCGGSSYFVNIHFGTGTGTLAPTRTSLFTHLGTKTAVDDTLVKAIPNSSWKRKIVLNPEEYVGSTLSEVGIAYGTNSSNLVTHAMLEDSEGNPITITKTDTDVITIYSTVFVTLSVPASEIHFINLPNNNTLVNYLVGGGSAPTGAFYVGAATAPADTRCAGLGSPSLGSTSTVTWTADTGNKKRTTNLPRFGISVGNGHVAELVFTNLFRSTFPMSGIFSGQSYTGVPIGTGDGVTKEFLLPSKNIRQNTIVIKKDGIQDMSITKLLVNTFFNHTVPYTAWSAVYNDNYGANIAFSGNGLVVAQCCYRTYSQGTALGVMEFTGVDWWSRPNTDVPTSEKIVRCSLNYDGSVLAVLGNTITTTYVADWNGTSWVKRPSIPSLPSDNGKGIHLSNDGNTVIITTVYNNYIHVYDFVDGSWVKRVGITLSINANISSATTRDCSVVAIATIGAPRLGVYDWNGSSWVARDVTNSLTGNPNSISISDDGLLLAVAAQTSPYLSVYKWVEGTCTAVPITANPISTEAKAVKLNADGSLLFCMTTANLYTFEWDGSAYVLKYTLATGAIPMSNLDYNDAKSILGVTYRDPGYFVYHNLEKRESKIAFDTAPAAGVAITADYTVDGVHKTDQYVIDVGFSIQFGEPA